jgi:hypothetical protein
MALEDILARCIHGFDRKQKVFDHRVLVDTRLCSTYSATEEMIVWAAGGIFLGE